MIRVAGEIAGVVVLLVVLLYGSALVFDAARRAVEAWTRWTERRRQ